MISYKLWWYSASSQKSESARLVMMQVLILALLFTQGLALAEHNEIQKVTVESKLKDDEAAGGHLHKLERRAIPFGTDLDEFLNFVRFHTMQ